MTVNTNVMLLDRYRGKTEIGRGGMGTVYQAYDTVLKLAVAIKVILPEIAGDPLFRSRFEKEAHLAAQLEHPNLLMKKEPER
jgi:serine/threonine protein kinase